MERTNTLFKYDEVPICQNCGARVQNDFIEGLLRKSRMGDFFPEPYTCRNCYIQFIVSIDHDMIKIRNGNAPNIDIDYNDFFPNPPDFNKPGQVTTQQPPKIEEEKPDKREPFPEPNAEPLGNPAEPKADPNQLKDDWITIDFSDKQTLDEAKYAQRICFKPSVREIPDNAFINFTSLREIGLHPEMERIGSHAFEGCVSLRHIGIPNKVIDIGEYAFKGCTDLDSVILPNQNDLGSGALTEIKGHTFEGCGLRSIYIPGNIKKINGFAFANCTRLASLFFSLNSVSDICDSAFAGCVELCSLSNSALGGELINIGRSAFSGCKKLTDVDLPIKMSSIGNYAFSGCPSLRNLVLPSGISDIDKNSFGLNKEHQVKNPPFRIHVLRDSETYQQIKKCCSWCLKYIES